MRRNDNPTRRTFIRKAALGAAAAVAAPAILRGAPRDAARSRSYSPVPFRLGIASYSLRAFPRAEAIEMIKVLRADSVSIKSFHLAYEDSPEELAAGADEFRSAGIKPLSGGVITFEEDTDEHVRMFFEYAKNAGLPLIIMTAAPEILPRIERFAKEYDIAAAIHNHGPEDKHYPAPSDALKYIEAMDPRMGLCVDVGHTARTGVDVVESLAGAGSRLLDIHMKDLADLSDKESQVEVGAGRMPVAAMFEQLADMNYTGSVNLEYEIKEDAPLPGMIESMAYMRGVVSGLTHG